jgi:hypothetical protein
MNEHKVIDQPRAYDEDLYAWSQDQAARLRAHRPPRIDWEHIAEEIESLGRSDQREVTSRLTTLLVHLLKWRYQPERRTDSWEETIARERIELPLIFEQSPSLVGFAEGVMAKSYKLARREAARQTKLPVRNFPAQSPFTFVLALDPDYWPEDTGGARQSR